MRPEFLVPEEKQLVAILVELARDGDRPTDLVGPGIETVAADGQSVSVVEEAVGVQVFVPFEIRNQPVKVARAGAADDLHVGAGSAPELRLIVAEQDLHLGDGVHADRDHGIVHVADGVERGAVERDVVRIGAAALRIDGPGVGQRIGAARIDDARQRLQDRHHVAAANEERIELTGGDDARALGARRLHRRSLRRDGHSLVHRADLQHDVAHAQSFRRREIDTRPLVPFESGRGSAEAILSRRHAAEYKVAANVRGSLALQSRRRLNQRHRGAGDRKAGRIFYSSRDCAGDALRRSDRSGE